MANANLNISNRDTGLDITVNGEIPDDVARDMAQQVFNLLQASATAAPAETQGA